MLNISKKRKWCKDIDNNPYHTYYFTKRQRGDYFNMWFEGCSRKFKNKVYEVDEMWTLKKVDEKTANHLYLRKINPICIFIIRSYSQFLLDKNTKLCDMKVHLYSIDDSSYSIWWIGKTKEELGKIRLDIMKWVDTQSILNGEELLQACLKLGANEEQINYD